MSNYHTKIKCPHCGKESYACVIDTGHSVSMAVFTYCCECRKYIISEDMLKFCRVQTKFIELVKD